MKLAELRDQYARVVAGDHVLSASRELRHDEIGHLLIRDENTPITEALG